MRFLAGLFVAWFGLFSAVLATTECVVSDFKDVIRLVERLDCAVSAFEYHRSGPITCIAHNFKPLLHIYKLTMTLEDKLDCLVDDIQCSCNFSFDDSEAILLNAGESSEVVLRVIETIKDKRCDFEAAVGPTFTHRMIGGSLKQMRFLTLDMLRSLECRIDDPFKEVVSSAQSELDSAFQGVIADF